MIISLLLIFLGFLGILFVESLEGTQYLLSLISGLLIGLGIGQFLKTIWK